jgi:hypothetical protein
MHAHGDDDGIRRDCADGACLGQRLPFANVAKRVNAASKRVPQIDPPTLFFAGALQAPELLIGSCLNWQARAAPPFEVSIGILHDKRPEGPARSPYTV